MNMTKIYKTALIVTISCLVLSSQSFAGKGVRGGGGVLWMNGCGGNYSSGQQNRNQERNRYGKQGGGNYQNQGDGQQNRYGKQGGENYQNQGNGQQYRDRSDQQNRDGIETPITTQDQQ